MMVMRIKICGITNLDDAKAAVDAGADALGFILYPASKRFIPIERAIEIAEELPPFVQTVAVTVNANKEFSNLGWRKQLKHFGLAQLHGQESPAHVRAVGKYLPVIKVFPAQPGLVIASNAVPVPEHMIETMHKVKAIQAQLGKELGREPTLEEMSAKTGLPEERIRAVLRMASYTQIETGQRPEEYESLVSAFMLDTPSTDHGGTGRVFDWSLAVEFKRRTKKPLILSGGLNSENVAKAIETVQPYAVDVNSGVESSPGQKDHAKLRELIRICKKF
jgi:phosphoribosylanthranilate isomerase